MNIQLNLDEVNFILAVLGKQPFETVVNLIDSIKTQAEAQLNAEQEKETKQSKK